MKIFIIIILFLIAVAMLVSSIVFTSLSYRILKKMSIHKDNYYIVYTTHELYPKYNKYKKLGDSLMLFSGIFSFLIGVLFIILLLLGYI